MTFSARHDTIWPADSVEFCPIEGYRDVFCCATYKLFESPGNTADTAENEDRPPAPQQRGGTCRLYHTKDEEQPKCSFISELSFAALPDLKWCHKLKKGRPLLAAADSEGGINFINLEDKSNMRLDCRISCVPKEVLVLSLDWQTFGPSLEELTPSEKLAASCSNGEVVILSGDFGIEQQWAVHDHEPWVTVWDRHDPNVLYTGGDDCKWKAWDLRNSPSSPIFVNKRFDAGVTAIQSHSFEEHILALGSYDGNVRLFDNRKPQTPLETVNVSGGVWRLKWHPSLYRKGYLLAACMHNGFKVLRFEGSSSDADFFGSGSVIKGFDEHSSLAYGVDWKYDSQCKGGEETVIASCSFYDHLLCTWRG